MRNRSRNRAYTVLVSFENKPHRHTCFIPFVELRAWFSSPNIMRGRARCCILSAFAFAFVIQLVIVFVYFPSSSISNGFLLDESAFPASPVMRVSSKPNAAANTTVSGALQPVQRAKVTFIRSMAPTQSASIDALHREPIHSVVIPPATLKQALAPSELDNKYDLVTIDLSMMHSHKQHFVLFLFHETRNYLRRQCIGFQQKLLSEIPLQIIGINTVSRTGSPDYLMRTLRALRVSARVHM